MSTATQQPDSKLDADTFATAASADAAATSEPIDVGARLIELLEFARSEAGRSDPTALRLFAAAMLAETLRAELVGLADVVEGGATLTFQLTDQLQRTGPLAPRARYKIPFDAKRSMAAFALTQGECVVSPSLRADDRFSDRQLIDHGVAAALTAPVATDRVQFGALGFYSRSASDFSDEAVELAAKTTQLLAELLAGRTAEQALRQSEQFGETVFQQCHTSIFVLNGDGEILRVNPACEQTTHYSNDEVRGQPFVNLFAAPGEFGLLQKTIRLVANGETADDVVAQLATHDGAIRRVRWSFRACGEGPQRRGVLFAADQTDALSAQAERDQAREQLERLKESVSALRAASDGQVAASALPSDLGVDPSMTASNAAPDGAEKRRSPRRTFNYRQPIAPMRDGAAPKKSDFFPVACEDISAGGLAFYLPERPDYDELVIALGKAPKYNYLAARITRIIERPINGEPCFLVGCQFVGRVTI